MTKGIVDNSFRAVNLRNWLKITDYWLSSEACLLDLKKAFFTRKINGILDLKSTDHEIHLLDFGCGNGWLLDLIIDLNLPITYTGIDFNPRFISYLEQKHGNLNHKFILCDLEDKLQDKLIGKYDIVFSCFSFFEISNLNLAYQQAYHLLKPQGDLLILTIDPISLLLAANEDIEGLKRDLLFLESPEKYYCSQKIDLGFKAGEHETNGILYSTRDFFNGAKKTNFIFLEYDEIVKTNHFFPKNCPYFHFIKP